MKYGQFTVVFALVALTGCATAVRGTTERVVITTNPANAVITTSLGHRCEASPCGFEVKRKTPFVAYAKKPGYRPGSIEIHTKVRGGGAAGLAGNVLVGGVIGIGVDAATGAALDHYPNPAHIQLQPLRRKPRPRPRPQESGPEAPTS